MPPMNFNRPTESELEILQLLWTEGPMTVREVNDRLNKVRKVGYTTSLKIMQIMAEKGMVERDTSSRTHIYHAVISEREIQGSLLDRFLENTFRGSASKLVMHLLDGKKASKSEVEEIKKLIQRFESKNKTP